MDQSEKEILETRARALAQLPAEEPTEGDMLSLLTFPVGNERYGVDITLVQEVQPLKRQMWSRVPCTPDFIIGAVNIRGRIYSVMDIGRFLGLPSRPLVESAHVLLVRGDSEDGKETMELGILADDVPQVAQVAVAEIEPASSVGSSQAQEYVHGVTGDMLVILDLQRLLADPRMIVYGEV